MSYRSDSHGRRVGGLLEACGATNYALRNSRIDSSAYFPVPAQHLPPAPIVFKPLVLNKALDADAAAAAAAAIPLQPLVPEKRRGGRISNKQKQEKAAAAAAAAAAALPPHAPTPPLISPADPLLTPIAPVAATPHKKQKPEVFCLCKNPYQENDTRFMIACDGGCQDWFHPECLGFHRVERKGQPESFFDVDNTKLDEQSTEFLCPDCELVTPSTQQHAKRVLFGQLVSKWCDVVDQGDSLRWRLLVEARAKVARDSFAACSLCSEIHHPMLPCPTDFKSNDTSQLIAKEEQTTVKFPSATTTTSGEDALVVGGKYQRMFGKVSQMNKKLALLRVESGGLLLIPHANLFLGQLASPQQQEDESFCGVRGTAEDGYISALKLPNGKEIFLGKFESKLRAARVHDVACRLEFGESGMGMLNFPETAEGELQSRCLRGPFAPTFPLVPAAQAAATTPSASTPSAATAAAAPLPPQFRDALRVEDWCDGLLQCLHSGAEATKQVEHTLLFLSNVVRPSAEKQMAKLCRALEQQAVIPDSTEDEMDLVMKKLVRARTPRAKNKGVGQPSASV